MTRHDIVPLLKLYSIPGIGSGRMRTLIGALGSPQQVLDAPLQRLTAIPGIDRTIALKVKREVDDNFVENQIKLISRHKVKILSFWDDTYPCRLKKIYDPPAFIFYKGTFRAEDDKALAIVGTRIPTSYGKMVTEQISKDLVDNGFTVVSGLARGVDTIAHQSVMRNKGRTMAILGSGLDKIYPPENKKLAAEIEEEGCLISEYPMDTKPDAGNFPRRNRIISGLSMGVVITEAGMKSGALITAFQALEQNREVFAVPGPITSGKSTGTNQLIKEGAKLVQNVLDILKELEGQIGITARRTEQDSKRLNGLEKEIYDRLGTEPLHVDQIVLQIRRTIPETLAALLTLELMGFTRQLSGKMFVRI
jgi:DNA processing protein